MLRNVILQPTLSPMTRPSGRPRIIAIDEPVTIMLKAMDLWLSGTIRTAMIDTIDQKIEWAQATPILENISIPNDTERKDIT